MFRSLVVSFNLSPIRSDDDTIINVNEFVSQYGYLGVFIFSVIDHSGSPFGLLLGIGLVTTGQLQLLPTLIVATAGGITSDIILYVIGFFGGNKAVRWFHIHSAKIGSAIDRGEGFLKKHGLMFLIWGRFIPVVGKYVALIYGTIKYKLGTFLVFTTLSAILITIAYGLPAYYFGRAANDFLHNQFFTFALVCIFLIGQIVGASIWVNWKKSPKKKNLKLIQKALLTRDDKHLILLRSSDSHHYPDHWDFPGGKLEKNEDPIKGIQREILEETGFQVHVTRVVDIVEIDIEQKGRSTHRFTIYEAEIASDKILISHEHSAYKWATRDEILRLKTEPFIKAYFERQIK